MFDLDHWREIGNALSGNKLRTALTAFGVFWGMFMLMVLLGSGNGLENGVTNGFADRATNSFFIWTRATSKPYRGLPSGRRFNMTNEDHQAIRERVAEARIVAPRLQLGGFRQGDNVVRRNKTGSFAVTGDYPEWSVIDAVHVERGRFLNRIDLEDKRKVAVIGTRVAEILFEPDEDPIGDHIRIRGVYFKVVGLHRPMEGGDEEDEEGRAIYVPFTTFQQAFNRQNLVGWFAITSQDGVPASVTEKKVLALLAERHRVHPDDSRAFGHFNIEERFNQVRGLFLGIRVLIWIVGVGTLAGGVIGVSNIMLVIVRERTREIGIRRAVGATPRNVVLQVVLEALLLTATAGYAGLIVGMVVMDATAWLLAGSAGSGQMFRSPGVSLEAALQALMVLVASGILAGLIPARRAARVRPVEALHAG